MEKDVQLDRKKDGYLDRKIDSEKIDNYLERNLKYLYRKKDRLIERFKKDRLKERQIERRID